jgi:hypothetical protein
MPSFTDAYVPTYPPQPAQMNGAAVLAEVIEIGDILSKGEEADWDVRTKAMIKLQELAPTASKYDSFATGLDKIKKHLVAQVIALLFFWPASA